MIGWAIIREINRQQRQRISDGHQTWPQEWKAARLSARQACQANPRLSFSATAELHFQQYVQQARKAQQQARKAQQLPPPAQRGPAVIRHQPQGPPNGGTSRIMPPTAAAQARSASATQEALARMRARGLDV